MSKWDYLTSSLFRSRYAFASHFISKCTSTIVEIGGWKNCIVDYTPFANVLAVDPLLEIPDNPRVFPYVMQVRDFPYNMLSHTPFTLLLMGFDIVDKKDLFVIRDMMHRAKTVIIEHAADHSVNVSTVACLMGSMCKRKITRIQLDFSGNTIDHPTEFQPYWKRQLIVIGEEE